MSSKPAWSTDPDPVSEKQIGRRGQQQQKACSRRNTNDQLIFGEVLNTLIHKENAN